MELPAYRQFRGVSTFEHVVVTLRIGNVNKSRIYISLLFMNAVGKRQISWFRI